MLILWLLFALLTPHYVLLSDPTPPPAPPPAAGGCRTNVTTRTFTGEPSGSYVLRADRTEAPYAGQCPLDCLYKDLDDRETWEGQNWGVCMEPGDCNCHASRTGFCPNLSGTEKQYACRDENNQTVANDKVKSEDVCDIICPEDKNKTGYLNHLTCKNTNGSFGYADESGHLVSVDKLQTTNISMICGNDGTKKLVTIYGLRCPCAREANITKKSPCFDHAHMLDASLSINSGDWVDRVCIDTTAPCWMETLPLTVGENKLELHFSFARNVTKEILVENVTGVQTFMIEAVDCETIFTWVWPSSKELKELTCGQTDVKEEEVKLYSDRENRLLTGKTYSCYVEASDGDRREVTISGQKMFHNFSSSAEQLDHTKQSRTFRPKNFKLNSARGEEQKDTTKPIEVFQPKNIKSNSARDEDERKKRF